MCTIWAAGFNGWRTTSPGTWIWRSSRRLTRRRCGPCQAARLAPAPPAERGEWNVLDLTPPRGRGDWYSALGLRPLIFRCWPVPYSMKG
jgi:hypothetical protein